LLVLALPPLGCSSGDGDAGGVIVAPPPNGTPPPAAVPVSALFVLGDSLSDVGNAAAFADYLLSQSIDPPTVGLCNPYDVLALQRGCDDLFYRRTRVSDGAVAVEHLAARLGLAELVPSLHVIPNRPHGGADYAVASAKARGPSVEDLAHQVDMLLLDQGSLPPTALYVVVIGGNDALDAWQALIAADSTAAQTSAAIVSAAVAAIGANVERLLTFGARRLVVANVPDLEVLPAVAAQAGAGASPAATNAAARAISDNFDRELRTMLERLAADPRWTTPDPLVVVRFDLRGALLAAQQAAAASGGNALDACFDSDAYRQSQTAEHSFDVDCAPLGGSAPRFGQFVFWDGIHPTGAAHAAIGTALAEQVLALFPRSP
jgi:phospholipase/lecithinase/hemolysin